MATRKRKKRRVKKGFLIFSILTSLVLILCLAFFAVVKFVPNINILPVKQVVVSGDQVYASEQIVSVSEISIGKSVLKYDLNNLENKLEKELPYVKNANISYSIDGTINIKIVATEVSYSVKTNDGYHNLDNDFKLLESSAQEKKGMQIYGIDLSRELHLGEVVVDKSDIRVVVLEKLVNKLNEFSIVADVIDLEDTNNIMFVYQGRYLVEVGNDGSLDEKMMMFNTISKDLPQNETGRILLKHWSDEDRYGSVLAENVDEHLNKY